MKKILIILFILGFILPGLAQQDSTSAHEQDSLARTKALHRKNYSGPRKASIMSAILPGLGQAYNKKYWKIPIIYAGFGGLGYWFMVNQAQYNYYSKNLRADSDGDPNTVNETRWSDEELLTQKVAYRKKRDVAAIGLIILYIFNVVDANVDAHLKTFDVSDDLSLQVRPWYNVYNTRLGLQSSTGLSITLNFK